VPGLAGRKFEKWRRFDLYDMHRADIWQSGLFDGNLYYIKMNKKLFKEVFSVVVVVLSMKVFTIYSRPLQKYYNTNPGLVAIDLFVLIILAYLVFRFVKQYKERKKSGN
jgi:hypothetical protein